MNDVKTQSNDQQNEVDDIEKKKSRSILLWTSFFLGDVRDGLTMINMQNAFLIVSKEYTEKQGGILFFVFGVSQFLFQAPAGYLFDYSDDKITWLSVSSILTTVLTLVTAAFAKPQGKNLTFMIIVKILQGAATSFIPPGINSITQGIVGVTGMTKQVASNEMMNHVGTVFIALASSILALLLYPDLGLQFLVSPVACVGLLYFLYKINPDWIDHNEARGLTAVQRSQSLESPSFCHIDNPFHQYIPPPPLRGAPRGGDSKVSENLLETGKSNMRKRPVEKLPSLDFGCVDGTALEVMAPWAEGTTVTILKAVSPLSILLDPVLAVFVIIVFVFNSASTAVLPLVMQTLAVGSGAEGMVLAGMCMVVSQSFMAISSELCGVYSGTYGRKPLFLLGLITLPVRCAILAVLLKIKEDDDSETFGILDCLIVSTQVLGGIGLGIFGTMYILVTSDISGGTGRFSMTLGLTTAASSIGCTVAGYAGESLAQDLGYREVFWILAAVSCIPPILYFIAMPETMPPLLHTRSNVDDGKGKELETSTTSPMPEEGEANYQERMSCQSTEYCRL